MAFVAEDASQHLLDDEFKVALSDKEQTIKQRFVSLLDHLATDGLDATATGKRLLELASRLGYESPSESSS